MNPLRELLIVELRDLLHAQAQPVKALPKMAQAAHHPKLKEAFLKHLQQTEGQVERLKTAFPLLGEKAQPKPCRAINVLPGSRRKAKASKNGELYVPSY